MTKKRRWCGPCAKQQTEGEAVYLSGKKCEDCQAKQPFYGIDGVTKRWCGGCGKKHGATLLQNQKMCEDCGGKQATCGHGGTKKRLWCAECAKTHDGSINITTGKPPGDKKRESTGPPGSNMNHKRPPKRAPKKVPKVTPT